MRIALIRLSAIGDILRVLPAWNNLHEAFPKDEFCAIVEDRHAFLLEPFKWISPVVLNRKNISNPFASFKEFKNVADQIRHCDVSLDFHGVFKSSIIPYLANIDHRWGDGVNKEGSHWLQNRHAPTRHHSRYDQALGLAKSYGESRGKKGLEVFTTLGQKLFPHITRQSSKKILLVPGSSPRGAHKRWPLKQWIHLAKALQTKYELSWCLGPSEVYLQSWLTAESGIFALPSVPLWVLAEQMMSYDRVISGDTSILHLAVILGIPVTALYGPSDPVVAGFPANSGTLLRNGIECSPCRDRSCQRVQCMEDLSVFQVLKSLNN